MRIARKYPIVDHPAELVEYLIITALLAVTSYQYIFVSNNMSYVDEILLLIFILWRSIRVLYDRKLAGLLRWDFILIFAYLLFSMISLLLRRYHIKIYLHEIFNNIKPLIVLLVFNSKGIPDRLRSLLTKTFLIINIPSIIMAIYQIQNSPIAKFMALKMRRGIARIEGFSGHPITFAFIMLTLVFCLNEVYRNRRNILASKTICATEFISYAILIFLMLKTQSRYPICLFFLFAAFQFIEEKKKQTIFLAVLLAVYAAIFIFTIYFDSLTAFLNSEINSTVRMYGIKKTIEIFQQYPLFGTGIGTFGSQSSLTYHSYVYDQFHIFLEANRLLGANTGNLFESGLANKIVENGLLGTTAFYLLFIRNYKYLNAADDKLGKILLICILFDSILNPIYRIPVIYMMSVCISNSRYRVMTQHSHKIA